MNFDAFISYSTKDKTSANAACAVLEGEGVRCWIAPRDIRPGVEWGASIVEAIDHCHVMVLIFSASATAPEVSVSGRTQANSSPPYRAARSPGR